MKRRLAISIATVLLVYLQAGGQVSARSGMAAEKPWASEHIEGLPDDVRRRVAVLERDCGNPAAAGHYFSGLIEAGGWRFLSLHFEEFACSNRAAVCDSNGCLHEIYVESRSGYQVVFRTKASDVRMTNDKGIAEIEVSQRGNMQTYRWNGRSFRPVGTVRNGR